MKRYSFIVLFIVSCFVFTLDASAKEKNALSFKKLSEIKMKNLERFTYFKYDYFEKEYIDIFVYDKTVNLYEEVNVMSKPLKLINVFDPNNLSDIQRVYMIVKHNPSSNDSGMRVLEERRPVKSTSVFRNYRYLTFVANSNGYSLYRLEDINVKYPVGGIEKINCSFEEFENMFTKNDFRLMKSKSMSLFEGEDKTYFTVNHVNTSSFKDIHYIVRKQKKGASFQYTGYVYTLSGYLDFTTGVNSLRYQAVSKSLVENVSVLLLEAKNFIFGGNSKLIDNIELRSSNNFSYSVKSDDKFKICPIFNVECDKDVLVVGSDIFNGTHADMLQVLFSGYTSEKKNNEVGKELTGEELKKKIEINNNVNIDNSDTNNNADNTNVENNNTNSNSNTNDSINNIKQDTEVKAAFEQTKSVLSTVKNIPQFFSAVIDMFPSSIKTLILLSFTLLFIAFILKIFL